MAKSIQGQKADQSLIRGGGWGWVLAVQMNQNSF